MSTNLIVNYLPQTLTDEEFRSMFLSIGPLKASKIVRDRSTGYSYGFGFVEYTNGDDADKAIQTLNGLQLQNKRIKVAFSRSGESIKGANLYVSNIPKDMSQTQLEEVFAPYGEIVQCRILQDHATGRSKGVGFVLYNDRSEADNAIRNCSGFIPQGATVPLSVKYADDNKGKARPPGGVQVVQGRGRGRGGFSTNGNVSSYGGYGYGGDAYGGYGGAGYGVEGGDEMGFGQGYGGAAPVPVRGGYGMNGRGAGRGYGPMRSQNRFNRYNPMSSGQPPVPVGNSFTPNTDGEVPEAGFTLFVYNIGPNANEKELWQLFSPYGTILKTNVIRDHQKDQGKGYGFVTMATYHEAQNAIQSLHGYRFVGKPLQVSFKTDK